MKVIEEDDVEGGTTYMKLPRGPLEPTEKKLIKKE
jgi:hypothetical protein